MRQNFNYYSLVLVPRLISPGMESIIEDKDELKYIGIMVDNELRYKTQMDNGNENGPFPFRLNATMNNIIVIL